MTANDIFVNERLARHYGVRGVYGSQMRRITLADDARRGLLGKGALLMVTSHAHRTSPVLRGKWVLENIIGVAPAPPPDDVPALSDQEHPNKPRSRREVNATSMHGATALHAAVNRGDSVVRLLVERGADLATKNKFGQTPLDAVAGGGARRGGDPPSPAREKTAALLRQLMTERGIPVTAPTSAAGQ